MPRALPLILGALLVAGCGTGSPPPPNHNLTAAPPPAYRPPPPHVATGPRPIKPIGAGVLAATVVEGYLDNEENELRQRLRGMGVIVARTGNALLINLRDDQLFEPASMTLSPRGSEILERIATDVRKFDSTLLVINGFTDTTGTPDQNMAVSQKRADAIAKQLSDDGVDQKRLSAKGFGDEILRIPTGPNVAEPRNRRIELKIMPMVKS